MSGNPRPQADYTAVHLTAEYWPYARTGGLAEAVEGLARYEARAGVPVVAVLPLYRSVREAGAALEPAGAEFEVVVGPRRERGRLWELVRESRKEPRVLFVEQDGFFDRAGIYGEGGADYDDNAQRFAFYTAAVVGALPELVPGRVLLHAHDWHTALAPVYARVVHAGQNYYERLATVLSVHNAGFQGHFGRDVLPDVGLPDELFDWQWLEWYGRVNWMKGGLVFCDAATTVSPTHAHELRTEAGGFGLHDTFISLHDRFVGILNGIDVQRWDPGADREITANYTALDLAGKQRCKAALQRAYHMPQRARTLVFGMSARLVAQKGLDLILGGHALTTGDAQFVFLGAGEARYELALSEIAEAAPERVAVDLDFTDRREHRLLAGADALLMPSLYEPCGLTQMRAQRYGALPVARRVGGLIDTIEDEETGFLFDEYSPPALEVAVRRALGLYADRDAWELHVRKAMTADFSWERSATRYLELYQRAFARRTAAH